MADSAECPKCKAEIYIDDPLHEGECYETECNECHKAVMIHAAHSVSYSAECVDKEHTLLPIVGDTGWVQCSMCGRVKREAKCGDPSGG